MKNLLLALGVVLVAFPAGAALQYEYYQTSRSDMDPNPPSELTARAYVDGGSSRVEFLAGNAYPEGTFVVSAEGSRKLIFCNPADKTYTEINAGGIASSIGTSNISVENLKSEVQQLDDHPAFAGIPTTHYRLSLTYDIKVNYRNMALQQSVRTIIDKWTTDSFGAVAEHAMAAAVLATGNPQIDNIVDLETKKISGFPLKQRVQVTTTNATRPVPGSPLAAGASQTRVREMTVTSIKSVPTDMSRFIVPAAYTRVDPTQLPEKAPMQVLNLEPPSGK